MTDAPSPKSDECTESAVIVGVHEFYLGEDFSYDWDSIGLFTT
jgi:hypothetical protein